MAQPPMPPGDKKEDGDFLGTAVKAVGLLAGAVALVYILGGLVIALRLLLDGFYASTVVTLLGQLPRELVVSTAMLEVLGPAATIGLAAALFYGALNRPRPRPGTDDRLDQPPRRGRTFFFLALIPIALTVPAFVQAIRTDGSSAALFVAIGVGLLATAGLAATGWYVIRRIARMHWYRFNKAVAAGAVWAGMALIPAVMLAGALEFEEAQACTTDNVEAIEGILVGETSDHLLLATDFEDEESVLSLASDRVTKSEFGDLRSEFICTTAESSEEAAEATKALGESGSEAELALAERLRPLLLFDRDERWRPLEVERFLDEEFADDVGHGACPPGGEPPCADVTGSEQLRGRTAYLDIHGEQKNGADFGSPSDCDLAQNARDCAGDGRSVIYYRRSSRGERWYWDYWWFFRYNDYTGKYNRCFVVCGDHEGDWEGITVITTAATEPRIVGAVYATHKDRVLLRPDVLPLAATHPLVFVADGTHASYPSKCTGECKQYSKRFGARLPEETHDGRARWSNNREAACEESECVRSLPTPAVTGAASVPLADGWAMWSGLWGQTCHNGCAGQRESSPRSPGRQDRFKCPWAPSRRATPGTTADSWTKSKEVGDTKRLLAACRAQRGGL